MEVVTFDMGKENACLSLIYKKCRNYEFCIEEYRGFKESIIFDLEELLVKDVCNLWIPVDKKVCTTIIYRDEKLLLRSRRYATPARSIFNYLEPKLKKYICINTNRELYKDSTYNDSKVERLLHGSIERIREELEDYQLSEAEEDKIQNILICIECQIADYEDNKYIRKSNLRHYYDLMAEAGVNYIEDNKYYPIIVDFVLDVAGIDSACNIASNSLKIKTNANNRKRYKQRIDNTYLENDEISLYRFVQFMEDVSVSQRKYHVLAFHLQKLDKNNKGSLCELFRKIFVHRTNNWDEKTNSKSFSLASMDEYICKSKLSPVSNLIVMGRYTLPYLE